MALFASFLARSMIELKQNGEVLLSPELLLLLSLK